MVLVVIFFAMPVMVKVVMSVVDFVNNGTAGHEQHPLRHCMIE